MEARFNRSNRFANENKGSSVLNLQKKVEHRRSVSRPVEQKTAPDLTDLMNDMFFGTPEKKVYNLTGGNDELKESNKNGNKEEIDEFDTSTRSTNSRLTQEWLEEAKRMVALSPTRSESPSRLGGSPRFAGSQLQPARLSLSTYDRRDPASRSARR